MSEIGLKLRMDEAAIKSLLHADKCTCSRCRIARDWLDMVAYYRAKVMELDRVRGIVSAWGVTPDVTVEKLRELFKESEVKP